MFSCERDRRNPSLSTATFKYKLIGEVTWHAAAGNNVAEYLVSRHVIRRIWPNGPKDLDPRMVTYIRPGRRRSPDAPRRYLYALS